MELHQLRYAVALARTGNFSRAAEQCHVAQPSLSQQIQKLEQELGERLFERQRQRTRLTAFGERFLIRAGRILREVEEAQREAGEMHELAKGEVVIGVLPTIAPYLLPVALAAFSRKFPGIGITVVEETTAVLLKMAAQYEVDFAIASLPGPDDQMEITTLLQEELFLALPRKHPLAQRKSLCTDDLAGVPFVLMKQGHCLGDQVLRFCERNDFQPKIRSRSAQIESMLSLVECGLGVSLIPAMARKRPYPGVIYRSLRAPRPERAVVAFWPKGRTPSRAAREFLDQLIRTRRKPS